ncbi:uncharacterized protein LOC119672664 [Teleopsis dalmanni]|uniref:uncharacterized protein LOC119672664 n=1 Tax=Teleopsis dalmanni TaxID=139649 RepID=UPI0018CE3B2E|nr:uncharacterized protein LOC119672664 [Teleopsis dalmanni]
MSEEISTDSSDTSSIEDSQLKKIQIEINFSKAFTNQLAEQVAGRIYNKLCLNNEVLKGFLARDACGSTDNIETLPCNESDDTTSECVKFVPEEIKNSSDSDIIQAQLVDAYISDDHVACVTSDNSNEDLIHSAKDRHPSANGRKAKKRKAIKTRNVAKKRKLKKEYDED